MTNLLLASRSPRRRELLALLGLPFEVITPHVDEAPQVHEPPGALAARLSQAKARAVNPERGPEKEAINSSAIIVACDTVVALDGELLGKPRDAAEAIVMLRRLREQPSHAVYSALTLLELSTKQMLTDVAETQLAMRAYTDAEIAAYVASGDPLDKAGGYAIQHSGFHPVAKLRGCYANVMGLPLCHLTRRLHVLGVEPFCDVPTACQAHTNRRCLVYTAILKER